MSTRLNTRFSSRVISRTSQSAGVRGQQRVGGEHPLRIALAAKHQQAEIGLVQPQMQQRVIQFARHRQRPERIARSMNAGEVCGNRVRSEQRDRRPPAGAGRAPPEHADN